MHQHLDIARGLTIAAAVVVAVVMLACGAARAAAPSPVEAGGPSDLINTPVCAVVESFDDPRNCRTTVRPEGKSRSLYRAIR